MATSRLRTPMEEVVAAIWAKVLGLRDVGVHDNFFALGGHSLLATQVVSRLREAFGVELPLRLLFQSPSVAGLAEHVEAARQHATCQAEAIRRISRHGQLALSFAQERLWFLDQLEPGNPFYNVPIALSLKGPLDIAALGRSLGAIVRRHEVLRTTFPAVDGRPVQVVADRRDVLLPVVELTGLEDGPRTEETARLVQEEAKRSFDLVAGPLLRARLLRLGRDDHVLLLTMHHIVSDGWSLGVLVKELAPLYVAFRQAHAGPRLEGHPTAQPGEGSPFDIPEASAAPARRPPEAPLPDLPIQYADFAAWQRDWLRGAVLDAQLAYWKRQLANTPPVLELPADRPRPPAQSYQGSSVQFLVDADVISALRVLSRRAESTLFMTLMASFATLLYRYSGRDDMVIGSPIANRNRGEIEPLIGFFVNTLALRQPERRPHVRRIPRPCATDRAGCVRPSGPAV